MVDSSELLIAHGFTTKGAKYKDGTAEEIRQKIKIDRGKSDDIGKFNSYLEGQADQDQMEIARGQFTLQPYPKPLQRYNIVYEADQKSIEPLYFWILNHLKYDLGYGWIEKINDVFSASEQSSVFGASSQRLQLVSGQVEKYLGFIGQFVRKDLFQMIRELRWIDERIDYHKRAIEGDKPAQAIIKGIWADMVDGKVQGQQATPNIFTMAQTLGYSQLPSLFFEIYPETKEDVNKVVDDIQTTFPVKQVLKRKLGEFKSWQDFNSKELKQRKIFTLRYMRQQYNIIRLYIKWLKPYYTQAQRLRSNTGRGATADMVSSFEQSFVDIEILGMRLPEKNKKVYACTLVSIEFRTRPQFEGAFTNQSTGYHKGAIHRGEARLTLRTYNWTAEQVKKFQSMKDHEDLEGLKDLDVTLKATLDALGDDLQKYLKEADEKFFEDQKEKKKEDTSGKNKGPSIWDPFKEIGKGFGEITGAFKTANKPKKKDDLKKEKETAESKGVEWTYMLYKNFKKEHGLYHF
jgi:hypothetical protein